MALLALVAIGCGDPAPPPMVSPSSTSTAPTIPEDLGSLDDPLFPGLGNAGYDVARYDLDLDLTGAELVGTATITATATAGLRRFHLDFGGPTVSGVRVDGAPAPFAHRGEELVVEPATPIPEGAEFEVVVDYRGTPDPVPTEALPFPIGWFEGPSGTRFVAAEPDAAHSWFPGNDHPSDKATFSFTIRVPDGWIAAANGSLLDRRDDAGTTVFRWEEDDPMATYLATVVVSARRELVDLGTGPDGIALRHVLPPKLASSPPPELTGIGEQLAFFAERFGPYPFDEYGIAVVDGFGHALETQTLSIFDEAIVEAPVFESVMAHEVVHQWFGNHVTPARWSDLWLSEGFATFGELLWLEHTRGRTAYEDELRERARLVAELAPPPPAVPTVEDLFGLSVYERGALALAALRDELGDDRFFAVLRRHVERHGGANATTDDFVAVASEIAGRDLASFLEPWLYGATIPSRPGEERR